MRSSAAAVALIAALGLVQPLPVQAMTIHATMCGTRQSIEIPIAPRRGDQDDRCAKACHAMCERRRRSGAFA